jgi:hypothetical protein
MMNRWISLYKPDKAPPSSSKPLASTAERPPRSRHNREEQRVPRYFFNVYDDIIAHDDEGAELPNVAAARLKALVGARALMSEQVSRGYLVLSHWIDVVDEQGDAVLTLTFAEAVDIKE